jgi:hypothetical protein
LSACPAQGHYAPAVASHIYRAKELGTGPDINLAGVAIGNGLTNPTIQFGAYADYAAQNGVISEGVGAWMGVAGWAAPILQQCLLPGPTRTAVQLGCACPAQQYHTLCHVPQHVVVALLPGVLPACPCYSGAPVALCADCHHDLPVFLQPSPLSSSPPCLQTRNSIMWWWPLCRFGTNMCNRYKWTWLCGLTLQVCQVRAWCHHLLSTSVMLHMQCCWRVCIRAGHYSCDLLLSVVG